MVISPTSSWIRWCMQVYAWWFNVDLSCLGRTIYARQFLENVLIWDETVIPNSYQHFSQNPYNCDQFVDGSYLTICMSFELFLKPCHSCAGRGLLWWVWVSLHLTVKNIPVYACKYNINQFHFGMSLPSNPTRMIWLESENKVSSVYIEICGYYEDNH